MLYFIGYLIKQAIVLSHHPLITYLTTDFIINEDYHSQHNKKDKYSIRIL
jgi:hypothetical protein